jgi:hypothetical protein
MNRADFLEERLKEAYLIVCLTLLACVLFAIDPIRCLYFMVVFGTIVFFFLRRKVIFEREQVIANEQMSRV